MAEHTIYPYLFHKVGGFINIFQGFDLYDTDPLENSRESMPLTIHIIMIPLSKDDPIKLEDTLSGINIRGKSIFL